MLYLGKKCPKHISKAAANASITGEERNNFDKIIFNDSWQLNNRYGKKIHSIPASLFVFMHEDYYKN